MMSYRGGTAAPRLPAADSATGAEKPAAAADPVAGRSRVDLALVADAVIAAVRMAPFQAAAIDAARGATEERCARTYNLMTISSRGIAVEIMKLLGVNIAHDARLAEHRFPTFDWRDVLRAVEFAAPEIDRITGTH
jgi:hypothetical protein